MLLKIQSYEQVFKLFFKFILAKVLVQNARGLMGIIFNGFNAVASRLSRDNYGFLELFGTDAILSKPDEAGFLNLNYLVKYFETMPTYLILIGACLVIYLILIGRLFEIIVYTVISPIPLATFAGEGWHDIAKAFIKSYAAVCYTDFRKVDRQSRRIEFHLSRKMTAGILNVWQGRLTQRNGIIVVGFAYRSFGNQYYRVSW